jgi:hypothetical protein
MLYSILIYVPEAAVNSMTPEQDAAHVAKHLEVHEKLLAQNKLGPVARLAPSRTAKQYRSADATVVDGPFAETKEQLLGFYVVDCESEQEAIDIARTLPTVGTTFEIRPVALFFPGNGLPAVTE